MLDNPFEKVALVGRARIGQSLNGDVYSSNNHNDRLRAVSTLLIRGVHSSIDEGRYTCSPSDGSNEASTRVYVLEGIKIN